MPFHAKSKTRKRTTIRRAPKRRTVAKSKFRIRLRRKPRVMALHSMIGKLPRQFVKLKWAYNLDGQSVSGASNQSLTFYPMGPSPLDIGTPTSGLPIYDGITLYAQYYSMARVHAAKIRCNVFNAGTADAVRTCLVAVPYTTNGVSNATNSPSLLASYNYEQYIAMNGVKTRTLGLATGSKNQTTLTMFRKSKSMLNKTSIRDDDNASFPLSVSTHTQIPPTDNWYFQLNTFNVSASTAQVLDYRITIEAWIELYAPNFIPGPKNT